MSRGSTEGEDGRDTVPDMSMEDTDASAPGPGESFTGAPTITPSTFVEDVLPDFAELASVDPDTYVFGPEIARGGMGRILSARDRRTGRQVAIKEILPPLMASISEKEKEGLVARFQREAHVTARLQHPSIVPVYEIGTFEGRPFFAMKKVDGHGLDEIIKSRTTLAERLELLPTIVSVAEALAYAHGQRVIHRDLKSSNILVGAFGETVVIDWGLAKDLSSDEGDDPLAASNDSFDSGRPLQTVVGSIFGTPHYMPPEQARGNPVDERADVYSIGSILYHLLSGKAPYQDEESEIPSGSLLQRLRERPPPALDSIVSDVPRDLLSIVDKAMSRDKSQRYRSAVELATDLADFTAGQRVGVHRYSRGELLARWLRRHKTAVATGVVLLAALLVTATVSILSVLESRDQARTAASVANDEKERAAATTDDAMAFMATRGRFDLLDDRPLQSLLMLSKAFRHFKDNPASKLMMAAAMRSIDALQMTLKPQDFAISSMIASPDKGKLVSMGVHGEVQIWDMESGALLSSFLAQSAWAGVAPSISRDGSKIVLAGEEGLRVWSTETGEEIASLQGAFDFARFDHRDRIITISPEGEIVSRAQADEDGVLLYDLPPTAPSWMALMSGDGKHLALTHGALYVLNLETDTMQKVETAHGARLAAIDFAPVSRRFVTVSDNTMTIWELDSLDKIATLKIARAKLQNATIALSSDGKLFATTAPDNKVDVYEVGGDSKISSFDTHEASLKRLVFSPDGKSLVSVGTSEITRMWDVSTGRLRAAFIGSNVVTSTAFSADGKSLFVSDSAGGISKWDAGSDIVTYEYVGGSSYTARDSTGRRLLVASGSALALIDCQSQEVIASWSESKLLNVARFSGDGSRIFTGRKIYKSSDGSLVRDLGVSPERPEITSISDDGSVVAVSSSESVRVWSVSSGKILFETSKGERVYAPIWLSPDGDLLFAMLGNFKLTMVELSSGKRFKHFDHKGLARDFVTFLAKPNLVVINRYPESIDVVDVRTGEPVHSLKGSYSSISAAPDGIRLIVGSSDSAVLWNTDTGEVEEKTEAAVTRNIFAAAVSRDGSFFAIAARSEVSVYERESGNLILETSIGGVNVQGMVFGPSDNSLVLSGGNRALIVDIHREARDPATIEKLVRERVSTTLEKGFFLSGRSHRTWGKQHDPGLLPYRRRMVDIHATGR